MPVRLTMFLFLILAISYMGLNMKSIRAYLATAIVALFAVTFVYLAPAFAINIPDDDDQDILIAPP
jgi:hypothetical protein